MIRLAHPITRFIPGIYGALGLLLPALLAAPACGAVHQVPADFTRITDAVAAASAGDSVLVAAGVYSTTATGESFPIAINTDLILLGAGMGLSVIDAEDQDTAIRIESSCRLSGFTVTGGLGVEGGGIRVVSGSPEIDHDLVLHNRASFVGSGIFVAPGGTPWIHHCVVWENDDTDVATGGDPHGIQFRSAGGIVEYTLVGRGDSNGLLINADSYPIVRNSIFYENGTPGLRGRGICQLDTTRVSVIAHNLFYNNVKAALLVVPFAEFGDISAATANDLDPEDTIYGNLDADPEFVAPGARDWSLRSTSPAIDAGEPGSPQDPDGTPADCGPYYFHQSTSGLPDDRDPGRDAWIVFPNPSRAATTFAFRLEEAGPVRVAIYDLHGRRVATVFEGHRPPGDHRVTWDGVDALGQRVPSGAYVARLHAAGKRLTQKVVLLR